MCAWIPEVINVLYLGNMTVVFVCICMSMRIMNNTITAGYLQLEQKTRDNACAGSKVRTRQN